MNLSCNPSGERRRFVIPWAWLLAGVCLLASMRASAQYDFLVGTEPTVPGSNQAFDVLTWSRDGCLYWYLQNDGSLFHLDIENHVIRITVGVEMDFPCATAPSVVAISVGPYSAGDYRIELYGAPDGDIDQSFLLDTLDFTIAEARVPQPAVIPVDHPAGLGVLGALALLLGWLRLRRGMG